MEFRSNKEEDNTGLVNDGNAAVQAINTGCLALAMTEVMVPYKNGIEIHHPIRKVIPKLPIIVLGVLGEEKELVLEAFNSDVSDFTPKPFNPNELAIRAKIMLL